MPDWPFFAYIQCNNFAEGSNSADLSVRLANLIMVSVVHYKMMNTLFQHTESVNLRLREMLITYCFCDFLFNGYQCTKNKNMTL